MKLKKVISGGQTGADITGLEEAKRLGIQTGGWVPRGCRTETGPNWDLVRVYGCKETSTSDYPTRTRLNALEADVTVWFGRTTSPGYACTLGGTKKAGRPDPVLNPTPEEFLKLCNEHEVINIAGNRASTNPDVVGLVQAAFRLLQCGSSDCSGGQ